MITPFALALGLLFAQDGPQAWVVLVKTEGAIPASWADNLQEVARTTLEESTSSRWVPPPQVSVDDAQIALGCTGWNAACVGLITETMKADQALVLEVQERGKGAWLTARVISSDGQKVRGKWRYDLPDRSAQGLRIARSIVRGLLEGREPTVVTVTTDVPGAEVYLDGELVGTTPLTLADQVSPGPHAIELRMEGRAPLKRRIDVKAGDVTRVGAVLSAAPPPPHKPTLGEGPKDAEPLWPVEPGVAWGTLGLGAAVAAVGGGLYGWYAGWWHWVTNNPCQRVENGKLVPDGCATQVDTARFEENSPPFYLSSLVLGIAGGALAVTGAALLAPHLFGEPAEENPAATAAPAIESAAPSH